jgi:hypothetical protein
MPERQAQQQEDENGMIEGRAPASPRHSFPSWVFGGPPPSNHSQFGNYSLRPPPMMPSRMARQEEENLFPLGWGMAR